MRLDTWTKTWTLCPCCSEKERKNVLGHLLRHCVQVENNVARGSEHGHSHGHSVHDEIM